jgi:hypothetical protein
MYNKTSLYLEFGHSLSNLGTASTVTIYTAYLCLNLLTAPDLKFQTARTLHSAVLDLITSNFKAN